MTNQEKHNELQQNVTHTWNDFLKIDKKLSATKGFSDIQDAPEYSNAFKEWQKEQFKYITFLTNSKKLNPKDIYVTNDVKDFGVWIPKDVNEMKGNEKCFVLHGSQPHTSMDKVFSGTQSECEKYAADNVKKF